MIGFDSGTGRPAPARIPDISAVDREIAGPATQLAIPVLRRLHAGGAGRDAGGCGTGDSCSRGLSGSASYTIHSESSLNGPPLVGPSVRRLELGSPCLRIPQLLCNQAAV